MKSIASISILAVLGLTLTGCIEKSSDYKQREQQERILQEGTTYTYTVPEATGHPVFLCNSIGYGLPAATQYTNPEKYERNGATIPQADPNGLFSPDSAEGTWVMCSDPDGSGKTRPVYVEPRIIVSPFKL